MGHLVGVSVGDRPAEIIVLALFKSGSRNRNVEKEKGADGALTNQGVVRGK